MDNKKRIVVAGHRGYKAKYPENTLLSFQKALELDVDMIELDIHLTKDKKLVVIHDCTVDRTTNGTGYVKDFTLDEIKELDAGSWFSQEYAGHRIPTLEEFLDLVSNEKELLFNVEIKEKSHETVDLTVEMLKEYGVIERCVMTCFDASIIKYMKQTYNLRCQGFPGSIMENFEEGDKGTYSYLYSVGIPKKHLTKELVEFFEDKDILPWSYCIDDEESTYKSIDCGVTLITCNNPVPPLKVLKREGLHS